MRPFLKPERGWCNDTPVPNLVPDPDYHPEEDEAIEAMAAAMAKMHKVFGPYQTKAMIEKELEWGPAGGAYHPIVCHDGTSISAQTRGGAMCVRKAKQCVFTNVEVWARGLGWPEPRCLSARELMALVAEHGGIKYGHLPPLDFGRDPALGDRNDDDDAADHWTRVGRQQMGVPYCKRQKGSVCNWHYEAFDDPEASPKSAIPRKPKYRVRASDPLALTREERRERCFTTSAVVGAKRVRGLHVFETQNSVYAGRECDRLVATTNLKIRDDGTVHASIVPTVVLAG